MAKRRTRRSWGKIKPHGRGRFQASYVAPDTRRRYGPTTFTTRMDAEAWLSAERRLIEHGMWTPPESRGERTLPTFGEFAATWMDHRTLRPRTKIVYQGLLDRHILPTFAGDRLDTITTGRVRQWHDRLDTGPTARAHAYSLFRAILTTAVDDELLTRNPVAIRGAGARKRAHTVQTMTPQQVTTAAEAMPPRLRALVLLTAWCGLRLGEALELRRADVERLPNGTYLVKVRRAVSRVKGAWLVGPPKTAHGVRDVAVPPHVSGALTEHLEAHTPPEDDALLFPSSRDPSTYLQRSTLNLSWRPAAEAAGVPGMRWHDLRHTGATLAAQAGATVPELMARIGHSTPAAALRYQHAAQGRDAQIAEALSRLAEGR